MGSVEESAPAVHVLAEGERRTIPHGAEIRLETGNIIPLKARLPAHLPHGYHQLRLKDGDCAALIVCPRRCHLPAGLRTWGWAVQLYALRSARSWGIGDLDDLRRLAHWSARELGAGVLQINPLCASAPVLPQQASPYYPSSRCFRNPLYLSVDSIAGSGDSIVNSLALRAKALNRRRLINRDAVFKLKMGALRRLYARFKNSPSFERYCESQGVPLEHFSVFCALAETQGGNWRKWPARYRHPDSPAVARFAAEHARRVGFHKWLQWHLDEQFRRAAAEIRIVQDLPIGFDPAGADAWLWQDAIAREVDVGAPPDAFNAAGQDWGLPPFTAPGLRRTAFEPFIRTMRANFAPDGGLRIDHAMGLFRLFWIPHGRTAADGCYVRCPADELLGILCLESERAGDIVIGEDLGTVEPGVRRELTARNILSYRVLWFESKPPEKYSELSLATATTHDLPTIAGVWTGSDLADQQRLGLPADEEAFRRMKRRLARIAGVKADAGTEEVIVSTHARLARAKSCIALATLEDALGVRERPNMPGTTDAWPNWSIALPTPLEGLRSHALLRRVAEAMADR